ncbi:transcriptional regulator [Streptococcus sp.]|uniref:helix-turn-helix domain-containing protein n=1 Tax=Streptococcus sp. TaxID=1306 RepID=UPI00399589CF
MKDIGAVFRQIRESRHISLEEATGGEFSRSMLSRFERGENDLTTQRFFQALQQIKTSLSEFSHLAGIDQHSFIPKLLKEHYENMSLEHDQALYQSYQQAYQKYQKKEDFLASIILKVQMLGFYPEVELTASQEELDFLHDYLFSVTIWGNFELNLFSLTSPLFSSRLYRQYTEELVQREDFKLLLDSSRPAINSIFLNGFFLAISSNEFEDACFFDHLINDHFYSENEAYLRTVYLYAKGEFLYRKGEKEIGLEKMEQAIQVLSILDCKDSANYYKQGLQELIKES